MGGPQQVLELGRNFHAGRAAANDDEREKRVASSRVRLIGRLLELGQGPVAEIEGVAKCPHADRVLGHPGHRPEVGHASERDHERVVPDAEHLAALPAPYRDTFGDDVDLVDVADLDVDPVEQPSQRHDHMRGLDRARDDVREERLEDEVVVAVDEGDRDAVVLPAGGQPLLPTQLLRQFPGRRHAGEPAAEDHDAFAHLGPRMPPTAMGRQRVEVRATPQTFAGSGSGA